jgi:hypothetical protein
MTFLAPYALFGLALLALPILVHLFKPRKMRPTPFSSLRWLKQTRQRLSRRIQWHQWLLFLVRAGIITLLVLTLARPLFHLQKNARPVDRFVLLDVGRGMDYQIEGEPTPLARARELAADLVQNPRPGDRTALVLAGARPRLLTPPVADAAVHLAALTSAPAAATDSRLSAALPLVRSLLPEADAGRDVELVFLTENRPQAWRQGEIQEFLKDLPQAVRVRVIDVAPAAPRNGWVADARLLHAGEERLLRVELGCSGESPQERRVRLGDDARPVTLTPGQLTRVDVKVPADMNLAEVRLEPADALPGDDQLFVNTAATAALRVLLVEPAQPGRDGRPVGLHLRTALKVLDAAGRQALELTSRSAETVAASDLTRADLILLAGVPTLADGATEALIQRVRGGAGLVVFLGDRLQEAFYNQKLFSPLQPGEGLLPAPLKLGTGGPARSGQPGVLSELRWDHPLLAPLHDPVLGDLTRCRFPRYCELGALYNDDTVLARFEDDTPALVEHALGAGRVLFFNTSANTDWGDLPRCRSYVPLLDRVLAYLSAGGVRRSFRVGESVTLPLPNPQPGEEVTVRGPDGAKQAPRLLGWRGGSLLHLDEVAAAGVYTVERAGTKDVTFVANIDRGQSSRTPLETKVLEAWWAPAAVEVLTGENVAGATAPGGWALWPTLALIAGVLLLVETIYVAVLCPRANPAVVGSVVPRRGILKPLSETPA